MKSRIFLFFLLASSSVVVLGQESDKLVREGRVWQYRDVCVGVDGMGMYSYMLKGDTLIDGQGYKKVYMTSADDGVTTYEAALREESSKVYAVMRGSCEESLLYDFCMNAGDAYAGGSQVGCSVTDVATLHAHGTDWRVLHLQGNSRVDAYSIVAGVGSDKDLLCPGKVNTELEAVVQDGKAVFVNADLQAMTRSLGAQTLWEYAVASSDGLRYCRFVSRFDKGKHCLRWQWADESCVAKVGGPSDLSELYHQSAPLIDVWESDGRVLATESDYRACLEKMDYADWGGMELPFNRTAEGYMVLYDFNLASGESVNGLGCTVKAVRAMSSLWKDEYSQRDRLELSDGSMVYVGIGYAGGGMGGMLLDFQLPSDGKKRAELVASYNVDNQLLMHKNFERNPKQIQLEPYGGNVATAIHSPQVAGTVKNVIYDLQGHRVTGQPKHGIYIKNGRKVSL